MDSLKITLSCIILLQWIDKTAMSDYQNFLVFEAKIFENSYFFTYIGNMYIKWKLESFWIQICHIEHDWFWKKIKNTQNKIFLSVFEFFSKPIIFYVADLNSEWFQLSFDIHIAYVGEKVWIFKNFGFEG